MNADQICARSPGQQFAPRPEQLDEIIVAAADRRKRRAPAIDRDALAGDLGDAYLNYRVLLTGEAPEALAKPDRLEALQRDFGDALERLRAYERDGRPGWAHIRTAARVRLECIQREHAELQLRLSDCQRTAAGSTKLTVAGSAKLKERRRHLDRVMTFTANTSPDGMLRIADLALSELCEWISLALRTHHASPRSPSALVCFVGHEIPRVYERHFGRKFSLGTDSPSLRFAQAVLTNFDIKTAQGLPFTGDTIAYYRKQL